MGVNVMISPRTIINNHDNLFKAIMHVKKNIEHFIVASDSNSKFIYNSCVFNLYPGWANLRTALQAYQIKIKKNFLGKVKYENTKINLEDSGDEDSFSWLTSSIAYDYQKDRYSNGQKVINAEW
jgi:hypothetical protein